ncbi:MAG: extradiol ring-cleavage dioxygenase [Hyphomonadaceae bacterium]
MAEILVMGITHFPALATPDEVMTGFIPLMLKNPKLPADLRDPKNWPGPMREEWGADAGVSAAKRHRAELVDWMGKCRSALDEFAPDFVLIWGDDQYENFKEDVVPAYCVNAHAEFNYHPPKRNVWNEEAGTTFRLPGARDAGKHLATKLIEAGFDTAYSYKPLHDDLGHAFANVLLFLDYERRGIAYPILPVSLNSYGRRVICQKGGFPDFSVDPDLLSFDPPGPTPWRLYDMGAETARILVASPWRVAIIASSGWSHGFLTPKNNYLFPDVAADRKLFDALANGDYATWRRWPAAAIEDSGQQEVLNWMCLAGALDALGRGPGVTHFMETWIFNSSKVFLISPPEVTQ